MSTAILISGQLRTFAKCYPTQRWHVFRHFPDIHFFITVQDECNAGDLDILRRDYGDDHVHADFRTDPLIVAMEDSNVAIPKPGQTRICTQGWGIEAAYNFAPYANAAPAHQLLLQHYYQSLVWKFFLCVTDPESSKFDTIIRLRPDQWFHSFDYDFERFPLGDRQALTPWWGRFGGVNDRFAILGREAARAYFTVYDRLPELLGQYHCPFHPESLVKAALEVAGCTIHETLRTEFTTLRKDGNHRPPEIMPWDIAHAALRAA